MEDYKDFARAWVDTDARLSDFVQKKPEAADRLVARLAEALDRRRRVVESEGSSGGDLIVTVDSARFQGRSGLDSKAWDELAELIDEQAKKQS